MNITRESLSLTDELTVEEGEKGTYVCGVLEIWMRVEDANKFFHTNMVKNDPSYITAFVMYYPESKDIEISRIWEYIEDLPKSQTDGYKLDETISLNEEERLFFIHMMEEHAMSYHGMTLSDIVKEAAL